MSFAALVERRSMGSRAASQGLSIVSGVPRNHESVLTKTTTWDGPSRVKLVKEGYGALALICTFIAGVQAQFISISLGRTGTASEVVNAFFFAGLFADIGAAILSVASARWYEMLTPEEAEHIYDWLHDSSPFISGAQNRELDEEMMDKMEAALPHKTDVVEKVSTVAEGKRKVTGPASNYLYITERWLHLALKAGPFVAILGLAFLLAGVMVWVWKYQSIAVYTLCTILCALLVILLPAFVIPHDRIKTLKFVKLRRYSGSG
ncbi:hypothetical protein APHAL10511_003341 [Amanita phalloides]|nr:hypothetical protein APHAL10511_003341 [Amanita phalloides]